MDQDFSAVGIKTAVLEPELNQICYAITNDMFLKTDSYLVNASNPTVFLAHRHLSHV